MPRGGKREGAGRKPRLTTAERGLIGAECERLWRQNHSAMPRTEVVRRITPWANTRLSHAAPVGAAMVERCWNEYRERRA